MKFLESKKFRRFVIVLGASAALLSVMGCASTSRAYHSQVMRGSVIDVDGENVYLCVGRRDGARVGQELQVLKVTRVPHQRSNPGAGVRFERDVVGTVRIVEIVDEHFARATVEDGTVEHGFVVELESK